MALDTVKSIIDNVKPNTEEFLVVSALGSFIVNLPFLNGFKDYLNGLHTHESFIYEVLSAAGEEIGTTIYDNVKRYIDYISNVDICKVRSLKSMLLLFEFKNTVLECIDSLPLEIVNLLDILSIDKKRLLSSKFMKPEFLARVAEDGLTLTFNDLSIDLNKAFKRGSLAISASCNCYHNLSVSNGEETVFKKLCLTYRELNYALTKKLVSEISNDAATYTRLTTVNDLNVEPFDHTKDEQLSSARIYVNDYRYRIFRTDVNTVVYDDEFNPIMVFDSNTIAELSSNGFSTEAIVSDLLEDIQNTPGSSFFRKNILSNLDNQAAKLEVKYLNLSFNEDPARINDEAYLNLLTEIFNDLLLGFLELKYNFEISHNGHHLSYYIYPNLGDDYYSKNLTDNPIELASYIKGSFEERIDRIRRLNHVLKSFNERKIADKIEIGDDSIRNYSGAELAILGIEFERRNAPVDFDTIKDIRESDSSQYPDKIMSTRGTYYRVKKVLEYANFIDNYYALYSLNGDFYAYDPNYYEIDPNIELEHVLNQNAAFFGTDPDKDINHAMVLDVAKQLAKFAIYISKIREKIKLLTLKNYMKGTNLLLIYIINEWLIDYSRHNKDKFLSNPDISADFYPIFESLSSHLFSNLPAQYTINVSENYDETEYFNIETKTTGRAQCSSDVNDRYWEKTTFESPNILCGDGLQYKIGEIEKFYLSTLNLKVNLAEIGSSMQNFLSTIYDLGANDSFIYKVPSKDELSIFSSTLSTGEIASDLFDRLDSLSTNWKMFMQVVGDDYSWPDDVVSNLISNVLETKLFNELSIKYLANVSAVYDKHYPTLNSLSSSVLQLSSDYNDFISSDYAFYFKKFLNCKYCYQDFDLDNEVYMCPYYLGNPAYDDEEMNLYEHLYLLDKYSTAENIKNWSLLCTLTYVYDEVSRLSSALGSIINNSKFTNDYGFVDINALTLDEELKYVYDFLNDNIKTRKEFLMSLLETLRQQANNCKTSYENLNNTFTNAVASYNDNDDGYTLGSDVVSAVSLTRNLPESNGWERTENNPKKDSYAWIYCKYVLRWYYSSGDGNYGVLVSSVSHKYVATDPLETRIEALLEYMNMPTAFSGDLYYYGLANEGTKAVCENVKAGIAEVETLFNSVVSLANLLFGTTTSFEETDLYAKILKLVDELVAIDETFLDKDLNIKSYKEYLKRIISISAEYIPVKQSFEGIFIDTELQSYLFNFIAVNDLTFENLDNLKRYRRKTDEENLTKIQELTLKMLKTTFSDLLLRKNDLEEAIYEDYLKIKFTSGNLIELYLLQILDTLLNSITERTSRANAIIDFNKMKILSYVDVISSEISSDLDEYEEPLSYYVNTKLSSLNFFNHPIYRKYLKLMLTYGGQEFCYDPYYNIKNLTHPSYQVHPYLWNIIKKVPGQTLLDSGFKSTIVDDLEDYNFSINSSKYFGKYGETINTWRSAPNGLVDWSGYVSRYEKSSNLTAAGIVSEVVDYDGIFYPPAVKQFLSDRQKSINCVGMRKTSTKLVNDVTKTLTHISALFDVDNELSTITKQHVLDSSRAELAKYTNTSIIDQNLNNAFLKANISSVTIASVINVVRNSIPATFFEKYYSHLSLPEEEYSRISAQLQEYGDWIADIATSKNSFQIYDIYKYGLDSAGNSYILLKQYDYSSLYFREHLSFKMKQDTLGELWIRLANHPIAFPAFSGRNPAYYTRETAYLNPSIIHLALLDADGIEYEDKKKKTTITLIKSRMKVFYDFEITLNQANIFLISYNAELGSGFDPFHKQFLFAWVIPNVINYYYNQTRNLEWLTFMNTAGSSKTTTSYATTIERIDFSKNRNFRSKYASLFEDELNDDGTLKDLKWTLDIKSLPEGIRFPTLVGYYVYNSSAIDFVYVNKRFLRSKKADEVTTWLDELPQFFVIRLKNGTIDTKTPMNGWYYVDLGNRIPTSGNTCVGFDLESMQTTLAFTTRSKLLDSDGNSLSNFVEVKTSQNTVNFDENTDGAVIEDPLAVEYNSHDVLTENITLVDYTRTGGNLYKKKIHDHNLNADISYIPSYPGYQHENLLHKTYSTSSYYNIELLGISRDLDYQAKLINPYPDPYLDYEKIAEESQFGRVYEDYIKDYDKTYKLISNPSLNNNMVSYYGSSISLALLGNDEHGRNRGYLMTIHLDTLYSYVLYNEKDYKTLLLLVYNLNTLGKNPYAISPLTSFLTLRELDYNKVDSETEESEYYFNLGIGSSNELKVTGTRTIVGTSSKFDSNYILNIERIECLFSQESKVLNFFFYIEDTSKPAFVEEGVFKILLYNPSDLTLFKYYHLLDAYGAVNCRYIPTASEFDDRADTGLGWGVFYDKSIYDSNDISSLLESYYIDDSGAKVKLKNVELSVFNLLSDVYCLRGNKQLGFKYDEELHFAISSDLYYFPSLNISYPKTICDYVTENKAFARVDGDLKILKRMFTNKNLFILNLDDPRRIANKIGKVDVPILIDDTDDVRAFEDWLSATQDDGIENYNRYDSADPKAFLFVKFHNDLEDPIESSINIDDLTYVNNKSLEEFLQSCLNLFNASPLKSEDGSTTDNKVARVNDFITIKFTEDSVDINDFSKMLRVYANYKKEENDKSVTLYFNYFNWFDSPYIKIEKNLPYIDTIEGTYLKLKSGEDGILDIIIQARYYVGGEIYGYRNIKVLSYHIYNISDDKPKFLILKTYEILTDSLTDEMQKGMVCLLIPDVKIDLDNVPSTPALLDVEIPINVLPTKMLSSEFSMTILYPKNILDYDTTSTTYGYLINTKDNASGVLGMTVNSTSLGSYSLKFKTHYKSDLLVKFKNTSYSLALEDIDICDLSGYPCSVDIDYGKISIVKENVDVLGGRGSASLVADGAVIADAVLSTLILVG